MSEMFKNYPQPEDYIPNNRPKCFKPFRLDIMAGETAIHTFEIPFNVTTECSNCEIIYKLGVENVVVKDVNEVTNEEDSSLITCTLSPEETKLFANTLLDTNVQIKFYMNDNSVIYSDIYPVHIKDALDANED